MEAETIGIMVALFTVNYTGMWVIWKKVNSYGMAIRILCREHSKNHGLSEIDLS